MRLAAEMGAAAIRASLRQLGLRPCGSTKLAMATRLVRARRAESLQTATLPTSERFDRSRAGTLVGSIEACRLCSGRVVPPRRTFCCDECVHFHMIRTSGSHVRKALLIRDQGVCALCHVDAHAAFQVAQRDVAAATNSTRAASAAEREALAREALARSVAVGPFAPHATVSVGRRGRAKAKQGSFWQADHILAVADGGGCCGLSNLRTLCSPCHAKVTAAQVGGRVARRQHSRSVGVADPARDPAAPVCEPDGSVSEVTAAQGRAQGSTRALLSLSQDGSSDEESDSAHDGDFE